MFFLVGTGSKVTAVGELTAQCPVCGRQAALPVARNYSYLHFFFIPLFKWDSHYFVTCPHCASVMEAAPEAKALLGTGAPVQPELLYVLKNNNRDRCPQCGNASRPGSTYCDRCGCKL